MCDPKKDAVYNTEKKIYRRKRLFECGLVLRILVTSASVPENPGVNEALKRIYSIGSQAETAT